MKRIGVTVGGRYVAGLQSVFTGVVRAADEAGWRVAAIRDGFDGLLFEDRYPDRSGVVDLTPRNIEALSGFSEGILGTARQTDPFRVRTVVADRRIEEQDRSDELLERLRAGGMDAVISIAGPDELALSWKLARKGLVTVCVPVAVENDVAATHLSFGFNSALTYVIDTLRRARKAARSLGRIAVVEVPGAHAGWLALQAGIAVSADAILIPEIPYDPGKIAVRLSGKESSGWPVSLVVASEGARPVDAGLEQAHAGAHVIDRAGLTAKTVTVELQRLTGHEAFPIVPGALIRGGTPTAVDCQLGTGFGAAAVRALKTGEQGVMVAFQPPDLKYVPLAEAVNRVRTVPEDSEFIQVARTMGISLGD